MTSISPDQIVEAMRRLRPGIGWSSAAGVITLDDGSAPPSEVEIAEALAAPAVEPVPKTITDRQFALEARNRGYITQAEALAFVATGGLPSVLQQVLATLPQAARDDAEITVTGATSFERAHPLTLVIGEAFRGSVPLDDFLDDFFRIAATR